MEVSGAERGGLSLEVAGRVACEDAEVQYLTELSVIGLILRFLFEVSIDKEEETVLERTGSRGSMAVRGENGFLDDWGVLDVVVFNRRF